MATIPDLPEGGTLAAVGAGLFGMLFAAMKFWKEFSRTASDIAAEKRIETAAQQAHNRIQALETALTTLQDKLNAAERKLGASEGEIKAQALQISNLESYKSYWSNRAKELELENKHLNECNEWFSLKVQQQSFLIAALKGDFPVESLKLEPIGPMPVREQHKPKFPPAEPDHE